jgi:predicted  nucleic acid-binding Zn-ribbon protein
VPYDLASRLHELREWPREDLLALIERLERENAELRARLEQAELKLARLEDRDDLILQYQQEIQLAKQRLARNT